MCKKKCLCWKDLRTPSIAVVVFSLTTSLLQILVEVAVFTYGAGIYPMQSLMSNEPQATIIKLYIALAAFDFFIVLFSIIFLIGVDRNGGHRYSAVPWIIWTFFYIIFESAININYFTRELPSEVFVMAPIQDGFLIVPLVYWVVKDSIIFVGWWCVVSRLCYWSETTDSDSTLRLVPPTGGIGTTDSFGPIYYNGGSTHVQIRDNPRSACSHFDVARPTASTCQPCNWGRAGPVYGNNGGLYGPVRYMYTPN